MYGKSVTETVQFAIFNVVMILPYLYFRGRQTPKVTRRKRRKVYRDDTVKSELYVY